MARDETSTVLMTVAWLAGCTVGPDYKRPEVLMPADWRHGPEGRDSLCDLGWCELFKDPALHELISTAVVANRDLQVAVARVLESRAPARGRTRRPVPQVNAGAGYSRSPRSPCSRSRTANRWLSPIRRA